MTLGEHIQTLRKNAGYSQEALGEALGVTRQSISKWESDRAMPEIDKLIAMSHLFGVSVGMLLQVEEPSEALTDQELRTVENIVSRYLETAHPRPTPWKDGHYILIFAAIAFTIWLFFQTWGLVASVGDLRQDVFDMIGKLNTHMRDTEALTAQVEDFLTQQDRAVFSSSAVPAEMDLLAETVTFRLSAVPLEAQEGMTAEFSALSPDFEPVKLPGTADGAGSFTASLTCPLSDEILLQVAFCGPDGSRKQTLGQFDGLLSQSWPQLDYRPLTGYAIIDGTYSFYMNDSLYIDPGVTPGGTVDVASLRIQLYRGSTQVWETTLQAPSDRESIPVSLFLTDLRAGESLTYTGTVTDSRGRTRREVLAAYTVSEDGKSFLEMSADSWPDIETLT